MGWNWRLGICWPGLPVTVGVGSWNFQHSDIGMWTYVWPNFSLLPILLQSHACYDVRMSPPCRRLVAGLSPAWRPHEMGLKEYWQEAEIWSHISPHTYDDVMKISAPYTNRDRQDRPTTLKSIFEFLGLMDTNDPLVMPSWNGVEGVSARGWNLVTHKSTYLCHCDKNFSSLYQLWQASQASNF